MSVELTTREELERALSIEEPVIVEYYDPDVEESRFFSEVIKELGKVADPRLLFCRVNVKQHEELADGIGSVPAVRVFYKKSVIFEQKGCFGDLRLDLMVLRRGIRAVFEKVNLRFRI
ncbi:thioredoxin family protein [Thermogladius sp.]|uniref:thioredoxin family protein n=1 Tax=Thermogladius sp. TaxID=2023064 RepID=UPI003D0D480D